VLSHWGYPTYGCTNMPSRPQRRLPPTSFLVLALAGSLAIGLGIDTAIGYVVYHAGDYAGRRPGVVDRNPRMRAKDEHFHHTLRPSTRERTRWGPIRYELVSNSLGLKDGFEREVRLDFPGERILFLGDSFTEGIGVEYGETFVGLIDAALRLEGIEVLNGGVASYSPKLEYYKARYLIESVGLRLSEIVVFIDSSDAPDELLYNDFVPADLDPADTWTERFTIGAFPPRWFEYSVIGRSLRKEAGNDPWAALKFSDRSTGESFRFINARWEWNAGSTTVDEWARRGLESAAFYVDRLHGLCRRHQIRLSIGIYPWRTDVERHDAGGAHRRFWTDYAAQKKIDLYDLFPAFVSDDALDRARIASASFIEGDVHYSAVGHRRFAESWLRQYRVHRDARKRSRPQ